MPVQLRIAMRDWDFLTPILLGDVSDERFDLTLMRVASLPGNPSGVEGVDGAEVSLSRFVQQKIAGHGDDIGIANFPMRAFRHRCIITCKTHTARSLTDLKGGRIGVTGWQDSGNTWTRHALLDAGVRLEDVRWFAGRLTANHPSVDRLGPFAQPGWIEAIDGDVPMLELLRSGTLDAVFTPFMPEGFFGPDSEFRPVLDDIPAAEAAYFDTYGFVPGIHAMALASEVVARHAWLPEALSDLLDRAWALWSAKRLRYSETSPWLFDEQLRVGRLLPEGWNRSGVEENRAMIDAFVDTAYRQKLIPKRVAADDIFSPEIKRAELQNYEEDNA
ncbi:nitrate ABC transporter substrate-binding protein [uncultured Nitratireductor sp.]|uniref:nitrate ABC transporter substrate-binding protein n=1 Tax=uncultured Nitratireductor sp. TaxID=520953 RepID=UPI0025FD86C1|nr:nitrate ABC transporter substrate-binding protein [uncultured Nitratireductor sp.]